MSIEFFSELENKIDVLLTTLDSLKKENAQLKHENEQNSSKIAEIEAENANLKNQIESVKSDSICNQEKLNAAAERIQGILARLETVQ